jgi:hypothetical protein
MMYQIKLQCDTNAACYRMTDHQLIACYNEVFGIDPAASRVIG